MMRIRNFLTVTGLLALGAPIAPALAGAQGDVPQVTNTRLEVRDAGANLGTTMKEIVDGATGPLWIGYEVEEVAGERDDCCGNHEDGTDGKSRGIRRLEDQGRRGGENAVRMGDGKLEGGRRLWILLRAEKARIERIRLMPATGQLDAGGLRLVWLKDAKAEESVAFLSEIVRGKVISGGENDLGEQALTAIALYGTGAADQALEAFVAPGQPEWLREKTSFWMGATRGATGFSALKKMARTEQTSELRAKLSFALFVSREPGSTEEIIRMAREDASPHVRGQALFWLAQKAGVKAESAIAGAISDDPDTEVKKKVVFALSQMPKEEGVPKLIEVAEENKNPEVRKQAMFWLGQSEDPRALEFFEKVLRQ